MARQPFLPNYKNTPTAMAPHLIEELPRLAELVGRCAVNWSGVDLHLSLLLGSLVGVENPAAVAVFNSLRNHRAQRDALEAAAEKALPNDLKDGFDAILRIHKELDKQRNDVVHCVWGKADATPDGIIWSSLQDHATMLLNDYHLEATGKVNAENRSLQITQDFFVVRYADLERLNKEIQDLSHAARNSHVRLRYKDSTAGANAYSDFCQIPIVMNMLEKLRLEKNKS